MVSNIPQHFFMATAGNDFFIVVPLSARIPFFLEWDIDAWLLC